MKVLDPCAGVVTNLETYLFLENDLAALRQQIDAETASSSTARSNDYPTHHGRQGGEAAMTAAAEISGRPEILRHLNLNQAVMSHIASVSSTPLSVVAPLQAQAILEAQKSRQRAGSGGSRVTITSATSAPENEPTTFLPTSTSALSTPAASSLTVPASTGNPRRRRSSSGCNAAAAAAAAASPPLSSSGHLSAATESDLEGSGESAEVALGLQVLRSFLDPLLTELYEKYHLTQAELLQIVNLGACKPVELYAIVEECASRYSEEEVQKLCCLLQQHFFPHLEEQEECKVVTEENVGSMAPGATAENPVDSIDSTSG